MDYLLVITTCPNRQCAEELSLHLVQERLAACVNQLPGVRSTYQWQGQITTDEEVVLFIKTKAAIYPQLEAAICARHPYQVPEVIALPIVQGASNYLDWINHSLETKS